MTAAPNASYEYLKNSVMSASSEQLQLMLIDGAIRFATRAREAIERNDLETMFNSLDRAQQIVLEVTNGLNRDANPTLVDRIIALNHFIYTRLVQANMQRDTAAIDEALVILRQQRETWAIIIDKISREFGGGSPSFRCDTPAPFSANV